MNILKREVRLSARSPYVLVIVGALIGSLLTNVMLMSLFGNPLARRPTVHVTANVAAEMPEGLTTIVITTATEGVATCKEILELYEHLPTEELLGRPALLDQVGDCTLEALEPACGITDPLACVTNAWHAIVD